MSGKVFNKRVITEYEAWIALLAGAMFCTKSKINHKFDSVKKLISSSVKFIGINGSELLEVCRIEFNRLGQLKYIEHYSKLIPEQERNIIYINVVDIILKCGEPDNLERLYIELIEKKLTIDILIIDSTKQIISIKNIGRYIK